MSSLAFWLRQSGDVTVTSSVNLHARTYFDAVALETEPKKHGCK